MKIQVKNDEENLSHYSLNGMCVILCEDNILNQNITQRVLKKYGASVLIADNGQEALKIFQESEIGSIDAILMDIMMPIMDGFEATKNIRLLHRDDAKTVPIIAITANVFKQNVEKSLSAGMNEYLSKPVIVKQLLMTLLKYNKHISG